MLLIQQNMLFIGFLFTMGLVVTHATKTIYEVDSYMQIDSFGFYSGHQSEPNKLMKLIVGESTSRHHHPHFDINMKVKNHHQTPVQGTFVVYVTKLTSPNVNIPDFCSLAQAHFPFHTPDGQPTNGETPNRRFKGHARKVATDKFGSFAILQPFEVPSGGLVREVKQPRIDRSGMWIAASEVCLSVHDRHNVKTHVIVKGHNSYGYLNGYLYYGFIVVASLFVIYTIMCWLWLGLMVRHRSALMPHHWFLAIGLHLFAIECLFRFASLRETNIHGYSHAFRHQLNILEICHTLVTVLLATYARILVGFASTGVGIAIPEATLRSKIFIWSYGVVYAIAFGTLKFNPLQLHQLSGMHWVNVLALIIAVTDAAYLTYCLDCVMNVMKMLKQRNQHAKYKMYRQLGQVLVILMIWAIIGIIADIWCVRHTIQWALQPKSWPMFYLIKNGFWRILDFIAVCAVFIVMKPNEHSKDYLFSDQIPTKQTDADTNMAGSVSVGTFNRRPRFTFGIPSDHEMKMNLSPQFKVDEIVSATGGQVKDSLDDNLEDNSHYQMWTEDEITSPGPHIT